MSTHESEVLIPIKFLDNPLTVLEKIIDFDEFLQHLKIECDKYASQSNRRFVISFDEFRAFINIKFKVGYYKLHICELTSIERVSPACQLSLKEKFVRYHPHSFEVSRLESTEYEI